MGKNPEFINTTPSAHRLTGMSLPDLEALHSSLTRRGVESHHSGGSRHLRSQARIVGGELKRRMKQDRRAASELSPTRTGFPTLQAVFDDTQPAGSMKGVVIEAHHDDLAMFGLTRELALQGVAIQVVTLTDSAARKLAGYTPEQLDQKRWNEGKAHNQIVGSRRLDRISLPDGKLAEHVDEAVAFLKDVSQGADFFVAPNLLDVHPDHAAAHEIALEVAGSETPVYGMDTIDGFDRYGQLLVPDRYVAISRTRARREKRGYRANGSQVENLPFKERADTFNVLGMTKRRGHEIDVDHAVGVFSPLNTNSDPLAKVVELQMAA